ncbi:MFS transporter [Kribbella deserti]|uniref:Multidrug efflux pump Tap n=1 Tax=Kribbella deserti TaxID=1926257 RepID=A0ABV6QU24_9ACTN
MTSANSSNTDTAKTSTHPNSPADGRPERPNRVPLIAFLIANVVSISGTRVSAIAIPWLVLVTTGSAAKMGLVVVCEMAPLVISKALSGPLIDRIGPRRVSMTADTASAAVVGLIPILQLMDRLSFPLLLVLVGIAGIFRGPSDTAKGVMVPDIAEAARVPIERVTGLESTTDRTAGFIAPAIAGGLIALIGPAEALLVDAASFAVCAVLIAIWAPRKQADGETPDEDAELSYGRRLLSGWDFLRKDKFMLALVLMITVTNLLDIAYSAVLLPVWVRDQGYGPAEIGLLFSVFGVTATVGALVAAAIGERVPRRLVFTLGFMVGSVPRFLVMAWDTPLWAVVLVCLVGGFGVGFINPILGALFIERVPRRLLGRVGSLAESLAWAGMPLGGVLAGAAIAWIGLAPALVVAGVAYFAATTMPAMIGSRADWGGRGATPAQDPPDDDSRPQDDLAQAGGLAAGAKAVSPA